MSYEIVPLKSAGPFLFGMSTDQVRRVAEGQFKSFKRTPMSSHPCDHFPHLGVFANYRTDGKLEAVEFALPARPMFDGVSLLELGFNAVKALLAEKDPALEIEADGAISHQLGIALYAPLAKEDDKDRCESVTVFAAGYYD